MEKEIKVEMHDAYLEVSLKGNIDFSDYVGLMQSVGANKDLPKKIRVLGIDNGINIKFLPSDTIKISEVREQIIRRFDDVRHAYVVDNPQTTALAVLSSSEMQSAHYQVKIFSSKAKALDWLLE